MSMRLCAMIGLGLLAALICGCGGGGGGGGSSLPGTLTLTSEADLDGFAIANGTATHTISGIIGDYHTNVQYRAFVSFDISGMPSGATVDSAVLRIYQTGSDDGGYTLGSVKVDHVYYDTAVASAYDTPVLSAIEGTLSDAFSVGWKEITVTSAVQDDVTNARGHSQFRLYHQTPTDSDGADDNDYWLLGNASVNQPELVVTYH